MWLIGLPVVLAVGIALGLALVPLVGEAQETAKVTPIGYLTNSLARLGRGRQQHLDRLWSALLGRRGSHGCHHRPHPQGRPAGRPSGGAADELRTHHRRRDGQGPRTHHSAWRESAGGRGARVGARARPAGPPPAISRRLLDSRQHAAPTRRVRPGDPAPDVTLPAADREGVISLADYRGERSVLLAFFRGLYCPFCRRQMSQLALNLVRSARQSGGSHTRGRRHCARTHAPVLSIPSAPFSRRRRSRFENTPSVWVAAPSAYARRNAVGRRRRGSDGA